MTETDTMTRESDKLDAALRAAAAELSWPKPIPTHLPEGPSDDELLALAGGNLDPAAAADVRRRVQACPHCQDRWEVLREALVEFADPARAERLPSQVCERVKAAFIWAGQSLRYLSSTVAPCPLTPQPVAIRGGSVPVPQEETFHEFEADLGRVSLRLQVERLPSDLMDVQLRFLRGLGPEGSVRATLLQRGRVADSMPVKGDRVRFAGLPPADYVVQLTRGDDVLAVLDLVVLKEDAN